MNEEEQDQHSVHIRALLAFALSALVLFGYQYFFVKPAPPKKETAPIRKADSTARPAAAAGAPAGEASPPAVSAVPIESANAEQNLVIETDLYRVVFSNRGAVATSWTLKKYRNETGGPLELVNTAATSEAGFPFEFTFPPNSGASGADQTALNQALFQVEVSPQQSNPISAPVTLGFQWSDGRVSARKTFHFSKASYVVEVDSAVTDNGAAAPHMLAWRGGFGDAAVTDGARSVRTFYFDTAQRKVVRLEAKAAKNGPVLNSGNYLFAGIEDHFFTAAFLPVLPGQNVQLDTTALDAATIHEPKKQTFAGAAVGGNGDNRFLAYIGPKSLDRLRAVRPELVEIVNFGFFSFISYPLFVMLDWTHRYIPNFGWAIVAVTVVINFLLFPLKLTSMKSMKKMQKLQPLIKHINDKYKNLPMRDPRRQDQNKEVMELYSKYGVNPLGGCLPMVLQMPFLYAFYTVLDVSIEMRNANWLWIRDLSSRDYIYLLPILMVATQFLYQKMTPSTGGDPSQQKMMQFMPLLMGFFFYRLPSGLVLYWLTGNLVGVAQQWFINRLPEPDLALEQPKKNRQKNKAAR